MCVTCGCDPVESAEVGRHRSPHHAVDEGHGPGKLHDAAHGHDHDHGHPHPHPHPHANRQVLAARSTEAETRRVQVERDLLAKNDGFAAGNRRRFAGAGTLALNLVSSPGSGKTTLLVRTLQALRARSPHWPVAVVEGDQQTSLDADRIRATGAPAVQINTGKGCHLDAHQVAHALEALPPLPGGVLFIENVGNLVCPAAFDLGEAAKVVVLSCTEGADKPLKYPEMFRASRLLLLTKSDLLPYVPFSVEEALAHARRVNPALEAIVLSTTTGAGFEHWLGWIARELEIQAVRSAGARVHRASPAAVATPGA
jgi:hydrogenase nickel incorporation protein HypB